MNRTDIQWTWTRSPDGTWTKGSTWNPLKGCRRVSPGCGGVSGSCYAERLIATRLRNLPMYQGLAEMKASGPKFTGEHRMDLAILDEPLRTRKGRRIFVNDMGDLFYEGHTNEEIAAVFGVMASARQHTFQVLTKRAKRMAEWFAWVESERAGAHGRLAARLGGMWANASDPRVERVNEAARGFGVDIGRRAPETMAKWPLPNVWIGVTAEDRKRWSERVPILRTLPAAVHFVSVEPQMEDLGAVDLTGIQWLIQGGWSGPGAGPFDLAWMFNMRDRCREAGTVWFPKQAGSRPVYGGIPVEMTDSHGGNEEEWPKGLRGLRAFP